MAKKDEAPIAVEAPIASTPAEEGHGLKGMQTVDKWREAKKTSAFMFGAARAGNQWPVGKEMLEADYDAALEAVGKIQIQ